MRRLWTKLTLAPLVAIAAAAVAAQLLPDASGAHGRAVARSTRSWTLTLSAGVGELTLAEVSFPGAARAAPSARALRMTVAGPFGADYLAAASLRAPPGGARRALVLLVDRATPLMDPVYVHVRVRSPRSLGSQRVAKAADAFAPARGTARRALCGLTPRGVALGASRLAPIAARGTAVGGFDAAAAVAQAYDVACGLPRSAAFERAVRGAGAGGSPPEAPVGKLPGEGCRPRPGYACPLAQEGGRLAGPGAAPRPAAAGARRPAAAGAH
ncbi:MAG TPA: hypothetical protein VL979_02565 [Solirubrobacteraceae bacterium]|nr:hypothetical protein [Solirubrobacteraceae bacterium]